MELFPALYTPVQSLCLKKSGNGMNRKAASPRTALLQGNGDWYATRWKTREGNGPLAFSTFICHLRVHLESEEICPYQGKRSQIAMKTNFGYEEGRAVLFIIRCISLVANDSIYDHGSNLSIANVAKCMRALRHLHLRRQWTQEENRTEMCQ